MLNDVAGISIEGKCFAKKTDFQFFSNQNKRLSLIYGKNGSGKSTISNAFKCISNTTLEPYSQLEILTHSSSPLSKESLKNKIFIFNEEYIEQNIKLAEDGLNTVILFGEQLEIQKKIERKNKHLEKIIQYQSNFLEQLNFYNKKDLSNPDYCKKYLQDKFNSWKKREEEILKKRCNITPLIFEEIVNYKTNRTKDEVEELYKKKYQENKLCQELPEYFKKEIPQIRFKKETENLLIELFAKKIEQQDSSELALKIYHTIEKEGQGKIIEAQKIFKDEKTTECPFCFQKISKEYKENLIKNIEQVLNKDVEKHKKELENCKIDLILNKYLEFKTQYEELINNIEEKVVECLLINNEYNELIIKKQNNIYTPIVHENKNLYSHIQELNSLLAKLERNRKEIYEQASNKKSLVQELSNLNKELTALEFKSEINNYFNALTNKEILNDKIIRCNIIQNKFSAKIEELNAQKTNIVIGEKNINNALSYIFFYENRLKISSKKNKYYLEVNGNHVTPNNISIGERNILALAYFFTEIFKEQSIDKIYEKEILIVLDDPISSFDVENKIGIISYLRQQMNTIISKNNESKIIIFTHDIMTFFDFMKTFKEISNENGGDGNGKKSLFNFFELKSHELQKLDDSKNEYKILIENIYSFASSDYETCDQTLKIAIGNIMRRALEAFSTFMYCCSIEEVMRKDFIKTRLNIYSDYFGNLMTRLILNQESHSKDIIYKIGIDAIFYIPITDKEKHDTAKNILLFLYLIDKDHILTCLESHNKNNEVETKLEEWKKQLPILK